MIRRELALMVLAWVCGSDVASAQSYPARPITITVTAAPGGVTDVVARAVGQRLSESWGQQVIIENKGGAAHVLGAQAVAKAAPDGYSLLAADSGSFVINPTLYGAGKLPYDAEKDFAPITGLVRIHQALLAHPSVPRQQCARADCPRQKQTGRAHLRNCGHRLRPADEHAAVREYGRTEALACALSRRDTGAC